MMAFWQEALHYVPWNPPQKGWVVLSDPSGKGPNVSLNEVRRRLMGQNWLHFDLSTYDRNGEMKRLLRLGAKRHRQKYYPEDDFRVLEDPEAYGKTIADDNALQQIADFIEANGGSARQSLKILLDTIEEAQRVDSSKITLQVVKKALEQEKKSLILSELHELKKRSY